LLASQSGACASRPSLCCWQVRARRKRALRTCARAQDYAAAEHSKLLRAVRGAARGFKRVAVGHQGVSGEVHAAPFGAACQGRLEAFCDDAFPGRDSRRSGVPCTLSLHRAVSVCSLIKILKRNEKQRTYRGMQPSKTLQSQVIERGGAVTFFSSTRRCKSYKARISWFSTRCMQGILAPGLRVACCRDSKEKEKVSIKSTLLPL